MDNNNKSQAEIYREERKERLAKAASKKAKKNPVFSKAKRILGKVIAAVLVVALVLGAVGGVLNFFGTPQKTLKVSVAGNKEFSFTLAEFNYYYYDVWYQIMQTAAQYESQYSQYGMSGGGVMATGYDYTKSPDSQEYKDDYSNFTGITLADIGKESATWSDIFKYYAIKQIMQIKYGAKMAKEAGLNITPEQQTQIDDLIKQYEDSASKQDYSTSRYLRQILGNGITEKLIRETSEQKALANNYFEKVNTDTKNAITDEQINEKYNAARDTYDIVSLRAYPFAAEYAEDADDATKAEARKKAKANADEFLEKVTDAKSFIELAATELKKNDETKDNDADATTAMTNAYKSNITSNICEEAANWAFNADTKAGDKKVFAATEDDFFVVMLTATAHKDTSSSGNDVRHILFKFPEAQKDADGKEIAITDAQKATVRAEAEKVLELYKANPTEENFINLTKEHTEDVDTEGNPNNDGLYEGITASSSYVENFLKWSIDSSRKTGDVEIIETEFGYHIMYYVKSQGVTWKENIKNEILSDAEQDIITKVDTDYVKKVNMDNVLLKWAFKQQSKHINETILGMQQQQSSASN